VKEGEADVFPLYEFGLCVSEEIFVAFSGAFESFNCFFCLFGAGNSWKDCEEFFKCLLSLFEKALGFGGFFFFNLQGFFEFLDLRGVITLMLWGGSGWEAVVFFLKSLVFKGKVGQLMKNLLWETNNEVFKTLEVWLEFRVCFRRGFCWFQPVSKFVVIGKVMFEKVILFFRGELEELDQVAGFRKRVVIRIPIKVDGSRFGWLVGDLWAVALLVVLAMVVITRARLSGSCAVLAGGLGLLNARSGDRVADTVEGCTGAKGGEGVALVATGSLVGWGVPMSGYFRDVGRGWDMEWEQGLSRLFQVLDDCL
jgi:hypothetical protein